MRPSSNLQSDQTMSSLFNLPAFASAVQLCEFITMSFAYLFAQLPQPGDSEVTFSVFQSSCHLLLQV